MSQSKITFSGVRLLGFSRNAKQGGKARFRAVINAHVCEEMDWPLADERLGSCTPDGDLAAVHCEMIPKDKELRQWSFELVSQRVHKFEIIRRELEGKQGKGYRHELQFDVAFGDELGCAKLEVFLLNAGAAKCGLIVSYQPPAVQGELEGTRVDMSPDEDQLPLTDEARAAVAEMPATDAGEDNVAYVARAKERMELVKKRGRPAKDVQ